MSYRDVYEKWLSSSALSEAEKEELRSISGDEKEIESRFFAPLEFGTAGLRLSLIHISPASLAV